MVDVKIGHNQSGRKLLDTTNKEGHCESFLIYLSTTNPLKIVTLPFFLLVSLTYILSDL